MQFRPAQLTSPTNREMMAQFFELLNDMFKKLGVDEQTQKHIALCVLDLIHKEQSNPQHLQKLLMNLTDKKNSSLFNFLKAIADIAKSKNNYQIQTKLEETLKFLFLSEKQLRLEFKKNPLLLQKMELELKALVKELKQIAPEKAKELDMLLKTVDDSLDTIEEKLLNNQPLSDRGGESPADKLARELIEGLRGFSKFGGYVSPKLGLSNAMGLVDESELEIVKTMESTVDWQSEHPYGLDTRYEGVVGDTEEEVGYLNAEKEERKVHNPWDVPKGAPKYVPPTGSKED